MQDLHEGWAANLAELMAEHIVGVDEETGEPIRGATAKGLARECGLHWTTILRILSVQMVPSDEVKFRICGALGKRLDEVFPWPRIVPAHPSTNVAGAHPPKVARQATPTKRAARRKAA